MNAVKGLDATRLRVAFTGLDRAGTKRRSRLALAAVLARLGQPAEAWQQLERDLGRGLLDELANRQDQRLVPAERARLRELSTELEGSTGWSKPIPGASIRPRGRSGSRT